MTKGYITRYGFEWGPMKVDRACELPNGRLVLTVRTSHKTLEIYASKTGRSLRVFEYGKGELKCAD